MVQTYGGGDGGSGNAVERPDQAALPDRRRDLLEGGGHRGGDRQTRLLPRRRHGTPDLFQVLSGPIVNDPHRKIKKQPVGTNQDYLKNNVKLKF
jgi:hypothetical protein